MTGLEAIEKAKTRMGFITDVELSALAADPGTRLQPCLVRCCCGRFSAPAQDVAHFIKLVEQGGEHVRDVSVLGVKL